MDYPSTREQGESADPLSLSIKSFVSTLVNPYANKTFNKYYQFEEAAGQALHEVEQSFLNEKDKGKLKMEYQGFKTTVERWRRKLGKKFSKFGEFVNEFQEKCEKDVLTELKRVIGKLKNEKVIGALKNPCTYPMCNRIAKEKEKLEEEFEKISEAFAELKERFDKDTLKYTSSIRVRKEAQAELEKTKHEFSTIKDKLLSKENEVYALTDTIAALKKEYDYKIFELEGRCELYQKQYDVLDDEYNMLISEDKEKSERIKVIEGNLILVKADYNSLIQRYNELIKDMSLIQESVDKRPELKDLLSQIEVRLEEKPIEVSKLIYAINRYSSMQLLFKSNDNTGRTIWYNVQKLRGQESDRLVTGDRKGMGKGLSIYEFNVKLNSQSLLQQE
eukprot:TRINITY_DN2528_c0_g2_i5.p1 TRINITY_DN2528_c0_g2~~TRINITY_DN2528_c0_g2_i5.p1  ORF type:complete len:390 (+),score=53.21 TRINITY_DN2528_c0_g2_i5:4277-5446(+)